MQTKSGYKGKVLRISRLSAFIDIQGHDEMRAQPFLMSELTKVDPPKPDKGGTTENESALNLATERSL